MKDGHPKAAEDRTSEASTRQVHVVGEDQRYRGRVRKTLMRTPEYMRRNTQLKRVKTPQVMNGETTTGRERENAAEVQEGAPVEVVMARDGRVDPSDREELAIAQGASQGTVVIRKGGEDHCQASVLKHNSRTASMRMEGAEQQQQCLQQRMKRWKYP